MDSPKPSWELIFLCVKNFVYIPDCDHLLLDNSFTKLHEGSDSCWRRVELGNIVLVNNIPETARIRVKRSALELQLRKIDTCYDFELCYRTAISGAAKAKLNNRITASMENCQL